MTSQCLSEHTVPISARFHHLILSLANLSPLAIMNVNSYIWPIGVSFQDQTLSPHLKVIWDSQVEKTKIIAFLICQIYWCHTIIQCSQQHSNFCHSLLSETLIIPVPLSIPVTLISLLSWSFSFALFPEPHAKNFDLCTSYGGIYPIRIPATLFHSNSLLVPWLLFHGSLEMLYQTVIFVSNSFSSAIVSASTKIYFTSVYADCLDWIRSWEQIILCSSVDLQSLDRNWD